METLVWGSSHDRRTKIKTRFKNGKKLRVVHKLDQEQVRWIVREKRKDMLSDAEIARSMGVSARWVRKAVGQIPEYAARRHHIPARMGRPPGGPPGRKEHSAVISCCRQDRRMAVRLEAIIEEETGIHIPHHLIHGILKDEELAENQPRKARKRKWVRYERRFSNSLWHTDYKQLPDGRWFVSYQDDASRLIVAFGVFKEATGRACNRGA